MDILNNLLEYGIAGAVIAALLYLSNKVVMRILENSRDQLSEMTKQHSSVLQDMTTHVTKVVEANSTAMYQHSKSLESLTKAIHEQNKRQRAGDGAARLND